MIKEILIYVLVMVSSLLIMTFVVRMFLDGLVPPDTIVTIQLAVIAILVAVFCVMGWDVVRRRRKKK